MIFFLQLKNIQLRKREQTNMRIVFISGSIIGSKTRIATEKAYEMMKERYPNEQVSFYDLADFQLPFSDGRNYFDYEEPISAFLSDVMEADALVLGTPTFQASIPATLKNIFDMLPVNAFRDKIVGILVTAGSPKHYMMVEQQLKPILSYMKAIIVPKYVFIEEKDFLRKEIVNDDVLFRLERLVEDVKNTTEVYNQLQKKLNEQYGF